MKKLMTLFIISVMAVFVLTACEKVSGFEVEKETPEQAISNIITAIKEVNVSELEKYGVKELIGSTDTLSINRNKEIFETLDFRILSVEEDETSAKVKVELITKDLTTIPQDYANRATALTIENNKLGDNKLSEGEMKAKYSDLFVELVDECEYNEYKDTVNVSLNRTGISWKAVVNNKFHNTIYGNLTSAQSKVFWPPVSTN